MSRYIDADRIRRGVTDNMLEAEYLENHNDKTIAAHFRGQALAYATVLDGLDKLEREQPEVDLERDAVQFCFDEGLNVTPYQAKTIANHFYELGQRKAKEESK